MTDNASITAGVLILTGYFIGSIPFGYLAGRLRGIDIREHGSGNIGATNVLRTLGKSIGIPVLILDVLKGLIPVLIAQHFSDQSIVQILTAFATIMGHNYTLWLRFKGGKGIATSAGSLIPLIAIPLAIAVLIWVILFFTTRYVSVASIGAALAIPIVTVIQQSLQNEWNIAMISFTILLAILATWKHRTNIVKLYHGTENRFTPKPKKTNPQTDV